MEPDVFLFIFGFRHDFGSQRLANSLVVQVIIPTDALRGSPQQSQNAASQSGFPNVWSCWSDFAVDSLGSGPGPRQDRCVPKIASRFFPRAVIEGNGKERP